MTERRGVDRRQGPDDRRGPLNRRREDRIVAEFRKWRWGAVFGYLLLLAAITVAFVRTEAEISQNEKQAAILAEQSDAIRQAAPAIRRASVAQCERANDVRQDLNATRRAVSLMVASRLEFEDLGPSLVLFREQLRILNQPVPLVACRQKFPQVYDELREANPYDGLREP